MPVKHCPLVGLSILMVVGHPVGSVVVVVVVGFSGGGGVCAITLRWRQWLAPLGSTTQASALNPLSRASSSRSALAV
jgi:hypothetical protein